MLRVRGLAVASGAGSPPCSSAGAAGEQPLGNICLAPFVSAQILPFQCFRHTRVSRFNRNRISYATTKPEFIFVTEGTLQTITLIACGYFEVNPPSPVFRASILNNVFAALTRGVAPGACGGGGRAGRKASAVRGRGLPGLPGTPSAVLENAREQLTRAGPRVHVGEGSQVLIFLPVSEVHSKEQKPASRPSLARSGPVVAPSCLISGVPDRSKPREGHGIIQRDAQTHLGRINQKPGRGQRSPEEKSLRPAL